MIRNIQNVNDDIIEIKRLIKQRLIEDEDIFRVQALLSDYNGEIVPGKYLLDTSMKPTQMLEHISSGNFYIDPNAATEAPNDAAQ